MSSPAEPWTFQVTIVMVVASTPAEDCRSARRSSDIVASRCDYVLVGGRQLAPSVLQAGTPGVRVDRPRRGRAAVDSRRRGADRWDGQPVVLQHRPRSP